jgi:hypothetical protein
LRRQEVKGFKRLRIKRDGEGAFIEIRGKGELIRKEQGGEKSRASRKGENNAIRCGY